MGVPVGAVGARAVGAVGWGSHGAMLDAGPEGPSGRRHPGDVADEVALWGDGDAASSLVDGGRDREEGWWSRLSESN
ncbi:hypothetical protein DZF92_14550 [Clavibacter michiganensis subsp. insidiosus]|nr:hypothetical protein DZF92_14550 [Clavibacter michiganensis subsp. insidiosus]